MKEDLTENDVNSAVSDLVKDEDLSSDVMLSLEPKMQRFVNLYVTGQYSVNKLAQLLNVHPNTLFNWLRRDDVKEVIESMQKSTQEVVAIQLKALTLKAANKLNSLIDSPIDGVALQAVKDVLDRSGHKPKQEIKVDKTVTYEQKLTELIDTTIDVDYEVLD